jgi:hypothetical protein
MAFQKRHWGQSMVPGPLPSFRMGTQLISLVHNEYNFLVTVDRL